MAELYPSFPSVGIGVSTSFVGSWLGISFGFGFNKKAGSIRGSVRNGDIVRGALDWVRIGEQNVAEGKVTCLLFFSNVGSLKIYINIGKAASLSLYERVRIYSSFSRKSDTSVSDLATLALVARSTTGVFSGLGRMKGRSIWAIAQDLASGTHPKPPTLKINEKLVFKSLSVDEALDRLALASASGDSWNEDGRTYTPLEVLGCLIVRERVKKHMGRLFVQVVAANSTERAAMVNDEDREEEAARRMTVDAARELGGSVEQLGKAFKRVWKTTISVEDQYFTLPHMFRRNPLDSLDSSGLDRIPDMSHIVTWWFRWSPPESTGLKMKKKLTIVQQSVPVESGGLHWNGIKN